MKENHPLTDELVPMFIVPIIRTSIEEDTNELKNYPGKMRTSYGSSKVSADMRVLEKYPRIKNIILSKFHQIAENHIGCIKRDYIITTSWITLSPEGDYGRSHRHKNCYWSGVYYFQDEYPEGTGGISFINPLEEMSDYYMGNDEYKHYNSINSPCKAFIPKPKQLIFFPSYLKHQILKHNLDKPRFSLAFNIIPLGKYGEGDSSFDHQWVRSFNSVYS